MNIFVLDSDIDKCAQYHCVKHIGKMQLELAQLLCTALHQKPELARSNLRDVPYKSTHINHPCAIFTRKSNIHYSYVAGLLFALNKEYNKRYDKSHLSFTKMLDSGVIIEEDYLSANGNFLKIIDDIPECMPEEFIVDSPIESYRNYYKIAKVHLHNWYPVNKPEWI